MSGITALAAGPWRNARWLVLAPHPDDETLGAGALIADTATRGRLGAIVWLTDGSGSHPESTRRLAIVRRGEAMRAVQRLGGDRAAVAWLGWRDAQPYAKDDAGFRRTCRHLVALLVRHRIDAVAVTAAGERHCDHAAAFAVMNEAVRAVPRRVALFEYRVWSEASGCARAVRTAAMPVGRRRAALHAHRSQVSASMGSGFRLDPARLAMPAYDLLTLRKAHR